MIACAIRLLMHFGPFHVVDRLRICWTMTDHVSVCEDEVTG